MSRQSALVLALSWLLSSSPAFAQTGSPGTIEPGVRASTITCPGAAVFSAGSGPEVHVTRIGSLDQRNPLAPLTDAPPLTVIEVRIRGKLAAAHGPTFQEMRRAGPPSDLERELGNAITWEPNLASLPRNIQVIEENTTEVIAKLRFVKCLAPTKTRPADQRPVKPMPKETPAPVGTRRPAVPLPRGAVED